MAALVDGSIRSFVLTPEQVGLARHTPRTLRGGDAAYNAAALRGLLDGAQGAYRDTVLMNAGAGLVVAGKVDDLGDGVEAGRGNRSTAAARLPRSTSLVDVSNG